MAGLIARLSAALLIFLLVGLTNCSWLSRPEPDGSFEIPNARFAPADGTHAQYQRGDLALNTTRKMWEYIGKVELDNRPANLFQAAVTTVEMKVVKGRVGFGIVDWSGKEFLTEEISNETDGFVELKLYSSQMARASKLVLRNRAPGETELSVVIRRISILPQEPSGDSDLMSSLVRDADDVADHWFRLYLEGQLPILEDESATELEQVNAIRKWVYEAAPMAGEVSCELDKKYGPGIYDREPDEVLFAMQQGQGGYLCGGTADLLTDIYHLLGYDAWSYDMGEDGGIISHVASFVKVSDGGQEIYTIQDAYFNHVLMHRGRPLDFFRMIELLSEGRAEEIVPTKNDACKLVYLPVGAVEGWRRDTGNLFELGPVSMNNETAMFCHDLSLETFGMAEEYGDWLEKQVGDRNFWNIYLFPLDCYGSYDVDFVVEATKVRESLKAAIESASTD